MKFQRETLCYLADGINLTAICEAADWHLASTIDGMKAAGFSQADAEAFAAYMYAERGCEKSPENYLTDDQWNRVSTNF